MDTPNAFDTVNRGLFLISDRRGRYRAKRLRDAVPQSWVDLRGNREAQECERYAADERRSDLDV